MFLIILGIVSTLPIFNFLVSELEKTPNGANNNCMGLRFLTILFFLVNLYSGGQVNNGKYIFSNNANIFQMQCRIKSYANYLSQIKQNILSNLIENGKTNDNQLIQPKPDSSQNSSPSPAYLDNQLSAQDKKIHL